MNLAHATALVTGASGGIGSAIVREIVGAGGKALITGRDAQKLRALAKEIDPAGTSVCIVVANVMQERDRRMLCDVATHWQGGIDVLINAAGVPDFGLFEDASQTSIERTFAVNALAPLQLCRDLLPHLSARPRASIVNIGSVFGSIAYPGHAVYSATKFALRGFTEALRRELRETNVRVHYLAPRATRTKFNCPELEALNERFGVATDSPERVAAHLRRMLERERAEQVVGWPEKVFARINALLPRLVDGALAAQARTIRYSLGAQRSGTPCSASPIEERVS
jgi:short-subunit dehydrogenase